ncbi:hypothetical protein AA0115_g7152 [Alternaria tenuissima]|uniref:Heterokaryon incompatibility domain-containing protein n=1 Tax=Alternaria tenuissima TaxID=119927 RepID=A0AB37WDW6_9PLEO|nr:hypothetical protein AA0115_g7152 [Alternaria tenuissima]
MCRTTFRHIPLASPAEQIRLLKIQPDTDVIRLKIHTCELGESPVFVALSYEWGDGSEIHDIIIDGAVFKIRQNLRDALEHIRTLQADTSSTRLFEEDLPYFWIDAMAIDQSNDKEKPHQVSIMGKIYRQASHVIAWLGTEQPDDDSALAMRCLDSLPDHDYFVSSREPYHTTREEKAIRELCDRRYFQRIWIIQECVLAKKLHLVCGLHYCSWEALHKSNAFLFSEPTNWPVYDLFKVKSDFESGWHGKWIQDSMHRILGAAIGRQCSRFHDRIYGLLGIIQQSFQTTVMEVNYEASLEELMIKTQELLTSNLEKKNATDGTHRIPRIFKTVASINVQGSVAWYWQMQEILYKLDADVIKGFDSLETLRGEKERALTFQTICWIVGGYGVDLFSAAKGTTSLDIAATMRTNTLESRCYKGVWKSYDQVFIVHSRYTIGNYTYYISLTHPQRRSDALPDDYLMTEPNSWECRSLLEAYSKQVQSLDRMRESFKASTEVSDPEIPTRLPIQVEWMAFSNLLAHHFLSKCTGYWWPNRDTEIDGFVRKIERKEKDLGAFLSESLFSKYRMSVASTSDELPANALRSVEIEITNSDDGDRSSGSVKKTLVAYLYDNDSSEAGWEAYSGTESSENEE